QNNLAGEAQFQAQLANLVLEQTLERLNQFEPHFFWQSPNVMMALDHGRRVAGDGHGFDYVGIQGALRQKSGLAGAFGGCLEYFNEGGANDFAFAFRLGHTFEAPQEQARGLLVLKLHAKVAPKDLPHDRGFPAAQQAIIDENTGQLLADGLVQQRRRHARINTAAEPENDPLRPNLGPDIFHRLIDVTVHRPVFATAADVMDKIGENLFAVRRMDHLGMEL